MTEAIGSFEMVNVIEAKNTEHGGGEGELIENTSQYKVVTVDKGNRNSSGIWKYFGIAEKENATPQEQKRRISDRILCLLCFNKGQVHVYKRSTSSGNLWRHLHKKHSIPIPKERVIGSAIRVKSFNGSDIKFEDKFILDDEDVTFFSSELDVSTIVSTQKVEVTSEDISKINGDIFKDIGSLLINEVSKRPCLYDWTPLYAGKSSKLDAAWEEVYEALDRILDVGRLQKMWTNIRERYRKLRGLETQGITFYSNKYKYYDQLRFLDCDELIESTHIDTTIDSTDDFVESINDTCEEPPQAKKYKSSENDFTNILLRNASPSDHLIKAENSSPQETDALPNEKVIQIARTGDNDKEEHDETEQISRHAQTTPESTTIVHCPSAILDEFDLFGRFIAEKMRKLPRFRVDDVEIKIMEIFRNEDFEN